MCTNTRQPKLNYIHYLLRLSFQSFRFGLTRLIQTDFGANMLRYVVLH